MSTAKRWAMAWLAQSAATTSSSSMLPAPEQQGRALVLLMGLQELEKWLRLKQGTQPVLATINTTTQAIPQITLSQETPPETPSEQITPWQEQAKSRAKKSFWAYCKAYWATFLSLF